jgi:hypothetical protein
VERVEPGHTFDVPRTALLLTGSVKSLTPLPADFSLAVQNPHRKSSAADLLWPSNISSTWDGSGRPLVGLPLEPAAGGQDAASSSHSSGSNTAAGADSTNISVTVHDAAAAAAAAAAAGTPFSKAATAADAGHTEEGSLMQLVAPAELPPGEFQCMTQAMLLQVSATLHTCSLVLQHGICSQHCRLLP